MRPLLFLCALALVAGCASPPAADEGDDAEPAAPSPTPSPPPSPALETPTLPAEPPSLPPPTTEPPALPEGPSEYRTTMRESAFSEGRIEAPKLVTVFWVNEDSVTHSVVSTDGQFAGSGPIPPGGEFSRTFLTAGEFPYHCRYHGNMAGTLVVV